MPLVRANLHGCCAGCAVPVGLFKAMQVAAGLALPKDIEIALSLERGALTQSRDAALLRLSHSAMSATHERSPMNVKRLIVVLGLAGFIVMADNWVVSPLLPSIAHTLGVQPARAGILIAAYMLPFGLFQLLYGPLADRFGKLRVVGISLVFFTLATGLCAAGVGLGDLTAYRALTGVFAAATMPVSLALIGDLVPMQQRQQAIAGFMGIAFLGQATSMTIGGTIAALTSWRGVFLTYAVVAAVITVGAARHGAVVRRRTARRPAQPVRQALRAPARAQPQPAHLPRRVLRGPAHSWLILVPGRPRLPQPGTTAPLRSAS